MLKNISIGRQLIVKILSAMGIIFGILFIIYYLQSRSMFLASGEQKARDITLATAYRIQKVLSSIEKIPQSIAVFMENSRLSPEEIKNLISSIVANNPEIYGITISFEPYVASENILHFGPYYYRKDDRILYSDLAADDYSYWKWEWYLKPKETGLPVWLDPYYDTGGGNTLMTTYAVPFYKNADGSKKFAGVATIDISLDWLREITSSIKIFTKGYVLITGRDGKPLAHPDTNFVMKRTVIEIARDDNNKPLEEIGNKMMRGDTGIIEYTSLHTHLDSFFSFMPLYNNGWSLGVVIPYDELLSSLQELNLTMLLIMLGGFAALFIIIRIAARSITMPFHPVIKAAETIAGGNINAANAILLENSFLQGNDESIKEKYRKNEIFRLLNAFEVMSKNLSSLIGSVQNSGIQAKASATQIAASARQIEAAIAEQAASTKEVTLTTKNIAGSSNDIAETIGKVNESVSSASDTAESGRLEISKMEREMNELVKATLSISSKLSVINDKTNKISGIVTTINKISDQTNLLSLNAAIEAEKAGEYGKGFSVVAKEINRLADQTSLATRDIADVAQQMQSSVNAGVMETDKFAEQVRSSTGEITNIGERLASIIEEVRQLAPKFEYVMENSEAQADAAHQISEAMSQLSAAADQNNETLKEFSQATNQLNDAVYSMQAEVSKFKI